MAVVGGTVVVWLGVGCKIYVGRVEEGAGVNGDRGRCGVGMGVGMFRWG